MSDRSLRLGASLCLAASILVGMVRLHPVGAATIVTRPTLSPDAKPDSIEALRFCVDTSASDTKASACMGSTVSFCVDHINDAGGTDLNYSECETREAAFWDRMLNERYHLLMTRFKNDTEKSAKLKTAQLGWLKLRANFCDIIADQQGSTYFRSHMASDCQLKFTSQQALNLRQMDEELRR